MSSRPDAIPSAAVRFAVAYVEFFSSSKNLRERRGMTSAGPSRRIFRDVDNGNATGYTMPQVRRRQEVDK
jgi:hypothetical protein